ncbi:hypothetical protein CK203_115114 [Vitis vinifera]|uniref:Uncharacterized protein n=1 Tax=Vitis vinifera TaxID=29760 RepID=A0A438C9Y2_VITVI|nr:hypothetical protein CK203_115114 [Vitis vinifera]
MIVKDFLSLETPNIVMLQETRGRLLIRGSVAWLDQPFLEEEVHFTIFQLNKKKALRLDGFTIAMYHECWYMIKEDL